MRESERWLPAPLPEGRPSLIQHKADPENAEFPIPYLNGWLTPNPLFYRRNHFSYPEVDPQSWRLEISGAVHRPLRLSLESLRRMEQTSQWTTLECSGNKRAFFEPRTEGVQWREGAIGNAEWGGVPLARLLEMAGISPGAVAVVFTGADQGVFKETGEQVHFARSLPVPEALRPDVLLALTMNGEPVPEKHGGPVRLVVPGWYAMASVKWLTHVQVQLEPFQGPFQVLDYVYLPRPEGYAEAVPVTLQKVNGAIAQPADGAQFHRGPVVIRGAAWGGAEPLDRVEVSIDGGRRWARATWVGPAVPNTWRLWQYCSPPLAPGRYSIVARSIDAEGRMQPERAIWNAKGYGNNEIVPVRITVAEP